MTDITGFEAFAQGQNDQDTLPPVHLWEPDNCGDIGLEIRHDGQWWHAGDPINRTKIVKLFSRILRKDDDGIYLVTPYEKVVVHVATTPFVAIDFQFIHQGTPQQSLVFETNLGEFVTADADHPLSLSLDAPHSYPSVEVRAGLVARISRPCYFRLMETVADGLKEGDSPHILSSGVVFLS